MLRALHKSQLPIWHTEGFNPHPFATFALPLSLGFVGENESMDIRLLDDDYPFEKIITALNSCLPDGIRVFKVTEPVMKPGEIAYADFRILLSSDTVSCDRLLEICRKLFNMEEIMIDKKGKKGFKQVNLKPAIVKYSLERQIGGIELNISLPAGSTNNVNPNLILDALKKYCDIDVNADITRINIYNENFEEFK